MEGLRRYKFLETLFASHNQLRNLDKFLGFLSGTFAFLKELDLAANPLAEEPDYRLKIIHAMPQVELLDRHVVTVEERIRAAKLFEEAARKKGAITHASKHSSFSKGEKDLYREVASLRKLEEQKRLAEERERALFYKARTYVGIPVPNKKAENKDKFGVGNREDCLDDWEKNQVKRLFRQEFDKDKAGGIGSKEEIRRFLGKLAADECVIGKVPDLTEQQVRP